MFTDRILKHSNVIPILQKVGLNVFVWATSVEHEVESWLNGTVKVTKLPTVKNFRERINYLRRFNELLWAHRLNAKSILSMNNFNKLQDKSLIKSIFTVTAKMLSKTNLNLLFEDFLLRILCKTERSEQANKYLMDLRPDLVVIMNPFWFHESAVAIEATKLGIPIFSFIPSWDNITTKSRLTFDSIAYSVWSKIRVDDLTRYYPSSSQKSIYIIGAPQYDVFFQEAFFVSKEIFFAKQGWDTKKKIVLYCLGSPNFIYTEYEGALRFAQFFHDAALSLDYQLVVRPHPNKDNNELVEELSKYTEVKVQFTKQENKVTENRTQDWDEIISWVNSFRYADVIVNLSSTVIFDALLFDKEVVNIDFDPGSTGELDEFIKEINRTWVHLKPLFNHPAIYYADSFEDIVNRLKLLQEGKVCTQSEDKQALLQLICEYTDGESAQRFAEAIKSEILKLTIDASRDAAGDNPT